MTELKNVEQEVGRFRMRLAAAAAFVLFAFGLLTARLVYLQVYKHDELSTQAENNRIAVVPIVPNRGLILDRNGVVLANNYSAYTLELARRDLERVGRVVVREHDAVAVEDQPAVRNDRHHRDPVVLGLRRQLGVLVDLQIDESSRQQPEREQHERSRGGQAHAKAPDFLLDVLEFSHALAARSS